TSLPYAPVNAAFIGVGLAGLWKKSPAWAAVLALAIPVHAHLRINHWYRTSYAYLAGAKAAADKVGGPDDLLVCNERASALPLYFMDRRGWGWEWSEAGTPRPELLADAIKNGAKFYETAKADAPRYISSRYPVVYDDGALMIFRLAPVEAKGSSASRL